MSLRTTRPKCSPEQLISIMKSRGIKFEKCTEHQAVYHLKHNNYFRLSAYRNNYLTCDDPNKYANLDFAYLYDLAKADAKLRIAILKLCIDFEHYMKVDFKMYIDQLPDDGYTLVENYLAKNVDFANKVQDKLQVSYIKPLVCNSVCWDDTFSRNCPYWILMEVLDFGRLIDFYEFVYYPENYNVEIIKKSNPKGKYELEELHKIRELRNACAHNNCVIANLTPQKLSHKDFRYLTNSVQTWLSTFTDNTFHFSKNIKKVVFLNQTINLLYWIDKVMYKETKRNLLEEFSSTLENISTNKTYYAENDHIKNSYIFLTQLVKRILTTCC